jgi:hypothetical protein
MIKLATLLNGIIWGLSRPVGDERPSQGSRVCPFARTTSVTSEAVLTGGQGGPARTRWTVAAEGAD